MDKRQWIERFVAELEALGVLLSAVELTVMAGEAWMSMRDMSPESAARELYGDR